MMRMAESRTTRYNAGGSSHLSKFSHMRNTAHLVVAGVILAISYAIAGCSDSPETMLIKAKQKIEQKDLKSAEIELKALLQLRDSGEARYLLATIHAANAEYVSAEKEFQRALDGGYDRARLMPQYLDALFRVGKFKDVIAQAGSMSGMSPGDAARALTLVGRANLAMGKNDAAAEAFKSAITSVPDYVPARVALIAMKASAGKIQEASDELDRILAANPSSPEALSLKGDIELSKRQYQTALDFFTKAAASDPLDHFSRVKIATILIEIRQFDEAQRALDNLRKLTGPTVIVQHLQALSNFKQNKLDAARDSIQAALKIAPDYLPSVALGSQIFLSLKSYEQAESLANKIVERSPNAAIGYQLLAASLSATGAPEKALAILEAAFEKGVQDAGLYGLAGEAALRINDPTRALGFFEKAAKLDPKAEKGQQTGIALAHIASGKKDRGLEELDRASQLPGDSIAPDLALVMAYMREKQYDKAMVAVERLDKKQPASGLPQSLRASILEARGDLAGARAAYGTALERDPKYFPAVAGLAKLDLQAQKIDDAKGRFRTLIEKDPKSVSAMIALAQIEQNQSNSRQIETDRANAKSGKLPDANFKANPQGSQVALEWLKKARDTDKSSIPAVLALSGWYITNGQPKEAIPVLQDAIATNPKRIDLLDALGTAYLKSEQPTLAMEQFDRVIKVKPDSALIQFRMGQLKASQGDMTSAIGHFRKASELEPKALEPRLGLAAALVRAGKQDEARSVSAALQREFPKSPAGSVLEGEIAMAGKKYPDAIAAFKRAIALERSTPVQIKLSQAIAAAGNTAEADQSVRALIKERPDDPMLRAYAGQYFIEREKWSDAIENYRVVIAKQPENALAMNNLAWALNESKEASALEVAEKAYALAPKAPAVLDTLGVVLVSRGQAERGLQVLRQVVSIVPKAAAPRLHLAEALIKTGDKSGARVELDTLLKDTAEGPIADKARKLRAELG